MCRQNRVHRSATRRPGTLPFDDTERSSTLKLATYRDGSSDGQLVVVSRDLGLAHYATGIASRLQSALDDWNFIAPQLEDLFAQLQSGRARHAFAFEPERCMAPLPRPVLHVQGNAYPSHHAVLRRAAGRRDGAEAAEAAEAAPLFLCAAPSGRFQGPCADIVLPEDAPEIDYAAGLAVVTGAMPAGIGADHALDGVRLLLLTHCVSLHGLMPPAAQRAAVCAPLTAQGAVACAPVAVTPDELGAAWSEGRVQLALQSLQNGRRVGRCDAGAAMRFHFGQLLGALARYQPVPAGAVVGGGPVSQPPEQQEATGDRVREVADTSRAVDGEADMHGRDRAADRAEPAAPRGLQWPRGAHSLAERRAIEVLQDGTPRTPWLRAGDRLRSEMKTVDGQSVFGAIDHVIRC